MTGLGVVEVYDITPASPPVVTVAATKPAADESGNNNGEFTFTRTGDTLTPLTVNYGVGGSAGNGFDYSVLTHTVTFSARANTGKVPLVPNPQLQRRRPHQCMIQY